MISVFVPPQGVEPGGGWVVCGAVACVGLFVPVVPVDAAIVLTGSGREVWLVGADDFVAFAAATEQVLLVLEHHHPHCGLLISLLLNHCLELRSSSLTLDKA